MRVDTRDFTRFVDDVRQFQPTLLRSLRRELRAAAKPAAAAAAAGARSLPSKGRRSTGLREAMARSVTVEVATGTKRAGVYVTAKQSKMPANQRTLPRRIQRGRFRHPVFGDRTRWVVQRGGDWFDGPINRSSGGVHTAVRRACSDAERALGFHL